MANVVKTMVAVAVLEEKEQSVTEVQEFKLRKWWTSNWIMMMMMTCDNFYAVVPMCVGKKKQSVQKSNSRYTYLRLKHNFRLLK